MHTLNCADYASDLRYALVVLEYEHLRLDAEYADRLRAILIPIKEVDGAASRVSVHPIRFPVRVIKITCC